MPSQSPGAMNLQMKVAGEETVKDDLGNTINLKDGGHVVSFLVERDLGMPDHALVEVMSDAELI